MLAAVGLVAVGLAACSGTPGAGQGSRPPSATRAASSPAASSPAVSSPASSSPAVSPPASASTAAGAPSSGADVPSEVACAVRLVTAMPADRRAAQLLVVGLPADADSPPAAAAHAVGDLGVGGVILTGRSRRGVDATRALVRAVRALVEGGGPAPLVAVDQEGGAVQVLSGPGFSDIPRPREQGSWDTATLRERAAGWGAELAAAGVDLDLAPVAGVVAPGADNAPIGRFGRHYGDTPATAAPGVAAFVAGMDGAGVATSVKHFPGLGRATGNTDDSAGVVDDVTVPDDAFLEPFRAGVGAGAGFVMMSSATYLGIDPDRPALFSPTVVGLARSALDFEGVVMTDDVGAAVALAGVPVGERATRFVAAGGDLVLTVRAEDAQVMLDALVERSGEPDFSARVEQATTRVLTAKARAGLVDCDAGGAG